MRGERQRDGSEPDRGAAENGDARERAVEEVIEAEGRGGRHLRAPGHAPARRVAAFGLTLASVRGEDERGRKVRWLLTLLRPYRKQVAAMFAALLISTGAALAPPALAGLATSEIASDNPSFDQLLPDRRGFHGRRHSSTGARATCRPTWSGWVGERALQDLRLRIFTHLQKMSIGFFTRNRPGVLISRITNDVDALNQLISTGVVTLFQSTLTLLGVVIVICSSSTPGWRWSSSSPSRCLRSPASSSASSPPAPTGSRASGSRR